MIFCFNTGHTIFEGGEPQDCMLLAIFEEVREDLSDKSQSAEIRIKTYIQGRSVFVIHQRIYY